jgi:hypothetical protein
MASHKRRSGLVADIPKIPEAQVGTVLRSLLRVARRR